MQSIFMSDVEMGKKDDDHNRPAKASGLHVPVLTASHVQPRKLLKRVLLCVLFGLFIWLFIRNIPTDLGVRDHRRPVYMHPGDPSVQKQPDQKPRAPPFSSRLGRPELEDEDGIIPLNTAVGASLTYNGKVRFLNLAPSLRAITNTRGGFLINKNVLFAAASVKSMATLLPIACQMGSELRNYVHFVLMGRSEIDVEELQQINGIDDSCHIIFHDARPNYGSISTDDRMESSVTMAMTHIELYMHPQAIIIDGSNDEEPFLIESLREYDAGSHAALIELPHNGAKRIGWLTRLDSASLNSWNKISIDILIHAYPGASGSLIRLLQSLSRADFGAGSVPHVTIELPQKVDAPTEEFLEGFQWPPAHLDGPSNVRQLSLRHRIPKHGVSEEDSSVRFLESFWPAHPQNSHVLVLSPQAELSSDFFHYAKYSLLEYRYSTAAFMQQWDQRLFAISLELPTVGLDGTTKFSPPAADKEPSNDGMAAEERVVDNPTSFLWQAPNSNAALFLGERWIELHGFVAQMLETKHAAGTDKAPGSELPTEKLISKKFPSWLEYALQLCQARGFWTLYPSATTATALSTIHNELYRPPEEYEKELNAKGDGATGSTVVDDNEVPLGSKKLLETLPAGGNLAPFSDLPLLTWEGKPRSLADLNTQVVEYASKFRRTIGGCSDADLDKVGPETLFCRKED